MSDPASELDKLRAELAATKAELAQARAVVSTSEAMTTLDGKPLAEIMADIWSWLEPACQPAS